MTLYVHNRAPASGAALPCASIPPIPSSLAGGFPLSHCSHDKGRYPITPGFLFLRCWLIFGLVIGFSLTASPALAAGEPFPEYSCIGDNVAFWKKVYAEYPSSKGLVHDSENLGLIYEVVSLTGDDSRQGGRENECLVEAVKQKYKQILISLAQGRPPASPEEKRVAAWFGSSLRPERLRAAAENIRFQRCLSDRFQAGLVRSGRYLGQIKEIFSQYGLPGDLAYLPHVESSFDYQASSKSGAVGIWQLIRATGSRFLTINSVVDERRDPILASHAAAKFLQGNYRKLENWPLALTAYNHGLTAMLRARNSLGSYEKIYQHYDGPRFGFASKNFYAEFLAAREIAKNYQKYFDNLRLDDPLQTGVFTMNSVARAKDLAGHFKVDLATLAELNPALKEPVWAGQKYVPKGYRLRLPKTALADGRLAALPLPRAAEKARQQVHRVKRGETLGAIAQRYGVSQRALIASNQLGRRQTITVGQTLRLPAPETKRVAKKSKGRLAQKSPATN